MERKHVPDFLLLTESGPVVVDFKPSGLAQGSRTAFMFTWTRHVVERRGWRYEVWTGAGRAETENLRLLAGYRREWLFDPDLLTVLRGAELDGATLEQAFCSAPAWPSTAVRSAVLHLLWQQRFVVDLARPLCSEHVLRRRV